MWTKYNNPNKKKRKRIISRTEADIIATKQMLDDQRNGIDLPLSHYDRISDQISKNPSRGIY